MEINALWVQRPACVGDFARRLHRPAGPWDAAAERVRAAFDRYWYEEGGYCYDVLAGPAGDDTALRPNQILAVSLPHSPLGPDRQRRIVDACARHLLTSFGLRSLAPSDPAYCGRCSGGQHERDGAITRVRCGVAARTFALVTLAGYGEPAAARAFLYPLRINLDDYGVGPDRRGLRRGAPLRGPRLYCQAWSVA